MKIITLAFCIFSFSVLAVVHPENATEGLTSPSYSCDRPECLHPEAAQLTRDLQKGYLSKADYLEKFIWLEPTREDYALCVICNDAGEDFYDWSSGPMIFCHSDFGLPTYF